MGEVYKGTDFESLKTWRHFELVLSSCLWSCEPSASVAGCHASASAVTVTDSDLSEALSPNDPFSLRAAVSWCFITVTDVTYAEAFGYILTWSGQRCR